MPRPKGLPRTGGKPLTSRTYTCARPGCGAQFDAPASDIKNDHPCCSGSCASLMRERALGHTPAIVAKCGLDGCEIVVRRIAGQSNKKDFTGNVFCCREHFQAWRTWNASGRK